MPKEVYQKNESEILSRACHNKTRDSDFRQKEGRFRLDVKKVISYHEDSETLEQVGHERWWKHSRTGL